MRDLLNTEENYKELLKLLKQFISDRFKKVEKLVESEKIGIQLFPLPNSQVLKNTYSSIFQDQINLFKTKYSIGCEIDDIKQEYADMISSMKLSWEQSSGYVEMVWMLSIGIMLNCDKKDFDVLATLVENDNPNDFLIDFLIKSKMPQWKISSDKFKFNIPYKFTKEIIEVSNVDKKAAINLVKKYLTNEWYRGHADCGWYNDHKSKGNMNIHKGYWSFESGALVKILGLDDTTLKGLPYYPYDMVHWSDEKSAPSKRSWTILD